MNWNRLIPLIKQARCKSKRSYFSLFIDLAICYVEKYNYVEYFAYNFAENRSRDYRESFVCVYRHYPIITEKRGVSKEEMDFFGDKGSFIRHFSDFRHIDALDLRVDTLSSFLSFLEKHDCFFIKAPRGTGGDNVLKKCRSDFSDLSDEDLYHHLREKGFEIVEEPIKQHPEVSKLSASSVNTLRVFTARHVDGTLSVPFNVSRISVTGGTLDNASQGGAYTLLGSDGTVIYDYFTYYPEAQIFPENPLTGFVFKGFKYPFFQESVNMCLAAAERCASHWIGWDVAVTEKGPMIIEANTAPGPQLFQACNQLNNNRGRLPELEKALGISLR